MSCTERQLSLSQFKRYGNNMQTSSAAEFIGEKTTDVYGTHFNTTNKKP
jgi:hypothetical protein